MTTIMPQTAQWCNTPLRAALAWWADRDDLGGFRTAAAMLFPGWTPRRSCRAPHREDRSPSFSIYCNARSQWRFKDHATGEQGGLVGFTMLAGMDEKSASRWLIEQWKVECETGLWDRPRGEGGNGMAVGNIRALGERGSLNDEAAARNRPPHPNSAIPLSTFTFHSPYSLSDAEIARCAAMCAALAQNAAAIRRFAAARGWQPETLRGLALDGCLGLHEDRLVMIYPTGAKKRFKPLAPSTAGMASPPSHSAIRQACPERSRMRADQNTPGDDTAPDANALIRDSREAVPTGTNGMVASTHASSGNGAQAPKFIWMFGKPHSLWRGDRILPCTERVHITEGETAAISLIDEGVGDDTTEIVMTVPGASCWRNEWASLFHGMHATLWPDADAAGQRLKERIVASLAPVVKSIEIVRSAAVADSNHLNTETQS